MIIGEVKTNSVRAWALAARPKTLAGAAAPVIMGGACAWMWLNSNWMLPAEAFDWAAFAPCMLFAWIMQIDANFVNDYFDFKKGCDTERRLGPKRACAQGWITPGAMKTGILVTTVLACAAGLPLIWTGGPWMIAVGALCVLFCFLYTTKFSRLGLGDVLVLVFFGVVPVCCTYYVQAGDVTPAVLAASLASGLVIDTLLVINNFRDIEADRKSGKKTIIVRFGYAFGLYLYLFLGIAAVLLCMAFLCDGHLAAALLPLLYLPPHFMAWRSMKKIGRGRELNAVLGKTSRNMLLFALLILAGFMV